MHSRPALDRFIDKILIWTDDCWLWTASLDPDGYGMFTVGQRPDGRWKMDKAHRYAYMAFVGEIPEGKEIDHLCRVRSCVNPAHLETVTHRENIHRSPINITALHARQTHCKYGHEFTAENTYRHNGGRYCRACNGERQRVFQAKRSA